MRELLYALRRLRSSPTFTVAATLTLAIGIGATASIFSLVDGVLLRAFPYHDVDRVLTIWQSSASRHIPESPVSAADYFDWRAQSTVFTDLAGSQMAPFIVTGAHEAEQVSGMNVTPSYFPVLGLTPELGRSLSVDSTAPQEVVISDALWRRRFGGSPSVLGQTMLLDNPADPSPVPNHKYTVIGVMPPGLPESVDLWTRMVIDPDILPHRDARWMSVYGRLKPGATRQAAQTELATLAGRLAVSYPTTNAGWSITTVPLLDRLVGPVRPALLLLLAAALSVLLIGVANLANLFLVRCVARDREMAVRAALGASHGRLVRELVSEAAVLSVAAGVAGVSLALVAVRALRQLAPPSLPRLTEIGVDGRVLGFSLVLTVVTVLVFGTLPAWTVTTADLTPSLKQGASGAAVPRRRRLQDGLAVSQIVVALVLLVGAGLLVESFEHFAHLQMGFRPEGVLAAEVGVPDTRFPTAARRGLFLTTVVSRLEMQPGVVAASESGTLPGKGDRPVLPFSVTDDPPPDPGHTPTAQVLTISPDYFRVMGMPVLRGRGVLPTDDNHAVKIAVIDQLLAQRFFSGRDPIGRRLTSLVGFGTMEIVGIVPTVKENGLNAQNLPAFYVPYAQILDSSYVRATNVAVRVSGDPAAAGPMLRQTIASIDPLVPISDVRTMPERMVRTVGTTRFSTFLASLFAVVAVILGAIGIYSVLAYLVTQRQREIAVRIALGATGVRVMGDVVRRALKLVGTGIGLGCFAAWMLTRVLAGLFTGGGSNDTRVFVAAAVVFGVVALLAAVVPAFRTTRVDPIRALNST